MLINKIKSYFIKIRIKLFKKINNYLIESQTDTLIKQLKSYGNDCKFYMPFQINGAGNVEIGNYVSISSYVHMWGQGGIKIGDRVMIASHTAITSVTHDHKQEIMHRTYIKSKVTIENDAWIGAHSVILPGITIGRGAVIGAGSIVTKDVEPYSIVFGSPAKHHRYRDVGNKEVVNYIH